MLDRDTFEVPNVHDLGVYRADPSQGAAICELGSEIFKFCLQVFKSYLSNLRRSGDDRS